MNWISVDNINDLEALDRSNCWEDSAVVEFYALHSNESYFPDDISRSGYHHKNIHLLVEADSRQGSHLEIVLIHCDHYTSNCFENIHFAGSVDSLKRVEIRSYDDSVILKCARIIYRWLALDEPLRGSYFRHAKSLS